eukprot:scaffold71150_cov75-Phaeocystis_antarctica.AAC.1
MSMHQVHCRSSVEPGGLVEPGSSFVEPGAAGCSSARSKRHAMWFATALGFKSWGSAKQFMKTTSPSVSVPNIRASWESGSAAHDGHMRHDSMSRRLIRHSIALPSIFTRSGRVLRHDT